MKREAYIAFWWPSRWSLYVLLIVGGMLAGVGLVSIWMFLRG